MRRSTINGLIREAKEFFAAHQFHLPPWAFWTPDQWRQQDLQSVEEIIANGMGWDITDFGSRDFERCGLLLFAIRNGNPARDRKPYAEKIMIVREEQETPYHFHWRKMEDIINRGGGRLVLELYHSTKDEQLDRERPIEARIDGIRRTFAAGEPVILNVGESICLEQHVYHRFYGEKGRGLVLVGEVSQVNDDDTDNRFLTAPGRFPDIDEDEAPLHLLTKDYARYVGAGAAA